MLLTTTLLVFSAAASAAPVEALTTDPAAAFRVTSCSTAAASGWAALEDPWLKARAPKAWTVADALARWEPAPSTSTFRRVVIDVDGSLKSGPKTALSMFGMLVPGKAPASGAWLEESLTHARERGDFVLGKAGTLAVAGRGDCALGVIERNARKACPGGPDVVCRRAAIHLDCGVKDGVQLLVTAVTPAYPVRGKPDGKAAAALAEIKTFLCTLESKK